MEPNGADPAPWPTDKHAAEASAGAVAVVHGIHSIAGWGLWAGFTFCVAVALTFDLAFGTKKAATGHHLRGAVISSIAWLSLGLFFALFLTVLHGGEVGFVFLTGYLLEKSLSVDNLVVIALVFRSFHIRPALQGPVLKWGILGAVVFRTIFIFLGVEMLEYWSGAIYVFGGVLLFSAYKMYVDEDDDSDELYMESHKKGDSWMMKIMTYFIPYSADGKNNRFFERIDGKLHATPMLAALVVVELSDLLFAVDSIPCILGLTQDLFLVFSSNMLAILGLRSLYLLLAEALDSVAGLKKGLAAVLSFVGFKMMLGEWWPLPQSVSLLIIFGILGGTVALSVMNGGKGAPVHSKKALPI